ncbi:MAG: hypothetical protein NC332_01930 [Firmicutes bacterium]|nr:hypothetical protein [Bacillota bacterium]
MRKASKILTLILIVVFLCGIFSGCAMFTRNVYKYRNLTAIEVGDETITVGKILDSFNNYYNSYGSYASAESLLEMAVSSLYTQAMKVDNYVKTASASEIYSHTLSDFCHNAKYLTEKEMQFCIMYVKYITFQSFDGSVINQLSSKRELKDVEAEDTSRDFTELDEILGSTYAESNYNQNFVSEDLDEYIEKYYNGVEFKYDASVNEYVYKNAEQAQTVLKEINDRIEKEEDKVSFAEYQSAQEKVVKQYERSIQNTYKIDLSEFLTNQISDMVASSIAAKYNYKVYSVLETAKLNETLGTLKENYAMAKEAQKEGFALNKNFESFIEGLSSTSYIYDVPQEYQGKYIYVKNILIPFTANQTAILSNVASALGGDTTNAAYVALRNEYASQIIAENFVSGETDGEVFALDPDSKLIIKTDGALGEYFNADGTVNAIDGKTVNETIIELMETYNTDTAQHTAQYDYVVRVGDVPKGYTHKWVTEFVDAANEAWQNGVDSYALAVSEYGAHIVYYSGNVTAQEFKFEQSTYLDPASPEYRLFKTYYSEQSSILLEKAQDALKKEYVDNGSITATKWFDTFLKDNGLTFDLSESLKDED